MGIALDLSAFTTTELETFKTEVTAALSGGALTNRRYKIGTRELERPSLKDLTEWASAISCELSARRDTTGSIALVQFDEQDGGGGGGFSRRHCE